MTDGPPRIFDRKALALHRARAARRGADHLVGMLALESLSDRLAAVRRDFVKILDLDGYYCDAPPLARPRRHIDLDDNERVSADGPYDLVLSNLGLHSVNDLPGVLVQVRRLLKPDGLFLASLFGGETLTELRQSLAAAEIETMGGISPRVAPFADVRDLGGLLQRAGFALPVADVERFTLRFPDLFALARDLRAMGETNALAERSRKAMQRGMLAAAMAHYTRNFADPDGKLRATFDIVYLTGWAPHESQQQPLKPGSAKTRLADALGTAERSTDNKRDR